MKGKSFVLSAIILALGGFFAKAVGALYKIPLTNILGSNGMGLYYLIFPVYSLILTVCGSGINVALAVEVSKCRKLRHRYNEQKVLRVSLVMGFVVSGVCAVIVLAICKSLADFQGNINAWAGYIAISPAIIISTLISTLRGYFQGVENMIPTTVSMIIEQIAKLSVGLVLAHKMCVWGIQYAVLGAIIGVTISEVVALIIITINFILFKGQLYYNYRNKWYRKKREVIEGILIKNFSLNIRPLENKIKEGVFIANSKRIRYSTRVAVAKMLKTIIPVTLSSIVVPIATMLDSFMIINILVDGGYSSAVSTSLYGLWGGVVQSLISLPTIIIAGVATTIVPSLSGVVAGEKVLNVGIRVKFFIKITLILSLFMAIVLFVFAEDILYFLYGGGLSSGVVDELACATKMLKLSSISVIYYALLQTFTAILQTVGKSYVPCVALLIGLIIKLVLNVVLVGMPHINIYGAIIGNVMFVGVAVMILARYLSCLISIKFRFWRELVMPLVVSCVVSLLMYFVHLGLSNIINYFVSMVITAVVGLAIYLIWTWFGKILDSSEKREFLIKKAKMSFKKGKKGRL